MKHASPLGSESLEEAAEETFGRGGADGLIVSGRATGSPVAVEDLDWIHWPTVLRHWLVRHTRLGDESQLARRPLPFADRERLDLLLAERTSGP